ncbi:hypothetical protein EXS57_01880 [Candidatus Kaiserbacteria bacterium]|nr:hypothetical protein [Candidatus Kaiserbacteria bacterium]
MMGGNIFLHWRALAATLFSVVLVVGAYLLARGIDSPPSAQASTESALLQAIATKDSNSDGLPDWQGVLYGIPINSTTTDYFNLGMTNGEAVARGLVVPKAIADITIVTSPSGLESVDPSLPSASPEGTLTDVFSKSFFSLYLDAKVANGGVELSASQINDLASKTLDSLSSLVTPAPEYKSAAELTVAGSGVDALKTFAAQAEAIIVKNKKATTATKSEILYLQDVVERGDVSALPHLVSIAKMYRDTAVGLATLSIPTELASHTRALINTLMRTSGITSDFARVKNDPLATILALEQYGNSEEALPKIFSALSGVYAAAGITLPVGTPGALFLNTVSQYRVSTTGGSQTP